MSSVYPARCCTGHTGAHAKLLVESQYMNLLHFDNFRTFVPFEVIKSGDTPETENLGKIRGVATSEKKDADDEIILQDGLDWSFFKSRGVLTYEHPLGALNIVGHPTQVTPTVRDGVAMTEIEGVLYLDDPLGKALFEKATTMKKAGGDRSLGFSIEGKVPKGGRAGKIIQKAVVHSVAISPVPKNPDSWWEPLAASLGRAFDAGCTIDEILERAEKMGYPTQGQAAVGSGGLDKLAPQSLQDKLDEKWLKGVTNKDLAVMAILKEFGSANWSQGVAVYETMRKRIK